MGSEGHRRPIDEPPAGTPASESVAAIQERVIAAGLTVGEVELRGTDRVIAVTAIADEPDDLADWQRKASAIVGDNRHTADWLVLIADPHGTVLTGAGASLTTWGSSALPLLE